MGLVKWLRRWACALAENGRLRREVSDLRAAVCRYIRLAKVAADELREARHEIARLRAERQRVVEPIPTDHDWRREGGA